ncbi:MAG: biotin synthase BioB [Candidatus Omnitrophica bacterium]|nr:biotin synthase BioB [Candidatus Omnitrophota bacterium]
MLDWASLTQRSLAGQGMRREEARALLNLPDEDILTALRAAFNVRQTHFGKRVKLCVLQNARSGLCQEDCHYCSQSSISSAKIDKYPLLSKEVTREIRQLFPLEICICVGLMNEAQAKRLKEAGVGWVNHNLNTSQRFYPEICSTHTYQDRLKTVRSVQRAGLKTCSGGIIGMGETDEDILDLAFAVREVGMDSIPVNFLHPISGTPLEGLAFLSPMKCLKALCLFRFLNPKSEIRAAGGREVNLRALQGLALYAANSIFVEGYLTTPGQKIEEARKMIEDMGFEVEAQPAVVI